MMEKSFGQFLKENTPAKVNEDNPLIYTLVIPKLVQNYGCKQFVKDDKTLFALMESVEKIMGNLDVTQLKESYNPITMMNIFEQDFAKKAAKEIVLQYLTEFEQQLAGSEVLFEDAYKIHSMFNRLKESTEFKAYIESL